MIRGRTGEAHNIGRRIGVSIGVLALLLAGLISAFSLAGAGRADPDTGFADDLHGQGIHGPKDYNAWIGKIACKRLRTGVDSDGPAAARFVAGNLAPRPDTAQVWGFLVAALSTYCPDQLPAVLRAAES